MGAFTARFDMQMRRRIRFAQECVEWVMSSREVLSEATKWLIELEAADCLDDVWPEFDDWFQASAAHRAAYAKVRSDWAQFGNPTASVQRHALLLHKRRWFCGYRWIYIRAWLSAWWPALSAIAVMILVYCAST